MRDSLSYGRSPPIASNAMSGYSYSNGRESKSSNSFLTNLQTRPTSLSSRSTIVRPLPVVTRNIFTTNSGQVHATQSVDTASHYTYFTSTKLQSMESSRVANRNDQVKTSLRYETSKTTSNSRLTSSAYSNSKSTLATKLLSSSPKPSSNSLASTVKTISRPTLDKSHSTLSMHSSNSNSSISLKVPSRNSSILSLTRQLSQARLDIPSSTKGRSPSESISWTLDQVLHLQYETERNSLRKYSWQNVNGNLGLVGLENIGNTCYMNSCLQCLLHSEWFVGFILSKASSSTPLIQAFLALARSFWTSSTRAISPSSLKRVLDRIAPQFSGYDQHDVHECLCVLLQSLHREAHSAIKGTNNAIHRFQWTEQEEDRLSEQERALLAWNRYHLFEKSPVVDMFGSQVESTVQCQSCGYKSHTYDVSWDLSLPLKRNTSTPQSLENCLRAYGEEEVLECGYKCPRCKVPRSISKRLAIYRFPNILVLHLKRFAQMEYRRDKISTPISIPANLSSALSCLASGTLGAERAPTYSLYAVADHSGGLGGGHYVARIKQPVTGQWYLMNDSQVSKCESPAQLASSSAYVLCYMRSND